MIWLYFKTYEVDSYVLMKKVIFQLINSINLYWEVSRYFDFGCNFLCGKERPRTSKSITFDVGINHVFVAQW